MATGLRDSISIIKANRMSKKAAKESTKGQEAEVVNPRVWNMYREAVEFKGAAIMPIEQELQGLESATIDYCEGLLPLLRAPLPRVWDRVGNGGPLAEPLRAAVTHYGHPDISGGNMDDAAIRASVADYERNLQLKVRRPLSQWVNALEGVRGRVPELDRLRKRLESHTRKVKAQEKRAEREERKRAGVRRAGHGFAVSKTAGVKALLYKCTHPAADMAEFDARQPEAKEEAGEEPSRAEGVDYKQEDQDVKYKEELRKLSASVEAFSTDEGLLYEQLSGLCRDAAWLKSYIASALIMTKELFQEMAIELGDTLQPLPACKLPAPGTAARGLRSLAPAGPALEGSGSEEGWEALLTPPREKALGSNLPYVAAMPDYAQRGRARATLEEWKEVARKRLHAHMATSSPLELHALPQARAGDIPAKIGRAVGFQEQMPRREARGPLSSGGRAITPETGSPASKVHPPATPLKEESAFGY